MEDKYEKIKHKNIIPIESFLNKFKKILGDSQFQKDTLISVLEKNFSVYIEKENIKISKNIATITASPVLKNEILINRKKILLFLKEKGVSIVDIR